jgi:hypothetical protein
MLSWSPQLAFLDWHDAYNLKIILVSKVESSKGLDVLLKIRGLEKIPTTPHCCKRIVESNILTEVNRVNT